MDICQWLWGDVTLGLQNCALEGNESLLLCCFSTFGTFIQLLYWLKEYAVWLWRNLSIGTKLSVRQNRLQFNSNQMLGDVKMLCGAFDSLLELWLFGGGTPECSCCCSPLPHMLKCLIFHLVSEMMSFLHMMSWATSSTGNLPDFVFSLKLSIFLGNFRIDRTGLNESGLTLQVPFHIKTDK